MVQPDIRHLAVFNEIYKTRSVSRAAEALGIGQPAVSIALARLREHFRDPLFVRTATGMDPTPMGEELVRPVRAALDALDVALGHRSSFDPAHAERTFHIHMTDISQPVLLPRLLSTLRTRAPRVRLEIEALSAQTADLLESGKADLAIGFLPHLEVGFFQQVLFRQHYVVMASNDHPRIRGGLTREQFEAEEHAVFATRGTGHRIVDEELARQGIRRRIALTIPNFLGAAFVIESTDLLMIIPRRLGELLRGRNQLSILAAPFPLPEYEVKQLWHERYHHDPGHRWLRAVIADLVSEALGPR